MRRHDDGSTLPLILGFFLLALTVIAGSVAAGDAFVQQRGLQDVCDGAATAAAASALDLGRSGTGLAGRTSLQFVGVEQVVGDYLARDPSRRGVRVAARLSDDDRTLTLTCEQTQPIAFGAMFGRAGGVHHVATSSARAPLS